MSEEVKPAVFGWKIERNHGVENPTINSKYGPTILTFQLINQNNETRLTVLSAAYVLLGLIF